MIRSTLDMMKSLPTGKRQLIWQILLTSLAVLGITIAALLIMERVFTHPSPQAQRGELDLRAWDFTRDGAVSLGGNWAFIPEQLVAASEFDRITQARPEWRNVPDNRFQSPEGFYSRSGSGSYRVIIHLPAGSPQLGLRFSTVWTAFEIEQNGTILARVGTPSMDPHTARPGIGVGIATLNTATETLSLIVRVSNHEFRWGGIIQPFILGDQTQLTIQKYRDDAIVFILTGTLIGLAINAFFFFVFRRRDYVFLAFTGFALMVALRILTTQDVLLHGFFPDIHFELFVRLGYLAQYLVIPMAALFFYNLFAHDISRWELVWYLIFPTGFSLLVPFAPLNVLSWSLLPYAVIAIGLVVYGYIIVCLRSSFRQRAGSLILLIAGTVLLGIVIVNLRNEILHSRVESAFPTGLVAFVIAQTLVMAKRSSWAFKQNQLLTAEIQDAYKKLMAEARVAEEARDHLEDALTEKEVLLREVHHRVKNSLQIILSIINLQARRITDPGALSAYRSISDRIRAISLVHERLFDLESEKHIDLSLYVRELLGQLGKSFGDAGPQFSSDAPDLEVPMAACLEIGLIITELVINAYQHASSDKNAAVISVRLGQEADAILLQIDDQGPGFPTDFRPSELNSVGFKIIHSLIASRQGRLTLNQGPGASIGIWLPKP